MRSVKRLFGRPRVTTAAMSVPRRRQFSQSPDGRTDGRADGRRDGIPGAKTTLHKGDEGERHEKPLSGSNYAPRSVPIPIAADTPTQMQLPE